MQTLRSLLPGSDLAPVATVDSVNPANTTDVVARVELAGPDTLVAAARTGHQAQKAWAAVPAPIRGRVIAAIGRLVEANVEALSQLITRKVGKPIAEARGEVQEVVDTCDFFLGEGRRLYGQTVPSEMPDKQLLAREQAHTDHAETVSGCLRSQISMPYDLCGQEVVWTPVAIRNTGRAIWTALQQPGMKAVAISSYSGQLRRTSIASCHSPNV